MEDIENKYRTTNKKNKEYPMRIANYIDHLISKGRILEAKHFFDVLAEIKPRSSRTIRLGYSLAINLFDSDGVKKYDRMLLDEKDAKLELLTFRLKYYYSRNNRENYTTLCRDLLSWKIDEECLTFIIETCLSDENPEVTMALIKYISKNKIQLSERAQKRAQKIILERLINTISRIKK